MTEKMNAWDHRRIEAGDVMQMAEWVGGLAPWYVIAHLTWKDWLDDHGVPHGITVDGASRSFERFMRKELPHLSYFYAVEPNPSRDGSHVHALWADAVSVNRREAWSAWFKRFGRARIEPVRSQRDVTDYCAKHLVAASYTTKQAVWWNVKLQWHRVQAQQGKPFELSGVACDAVLGSGGCEAGRSGEALDGKQPTFACSITERVPEGRLPAATVWRMVSPGVFSPV